MDFTHTHAVHLIGIGGTGLSAIARVLLESGWSVSGSDRLASPLALDLQVDGVVFSKGHAPQQVHGADLVIRSSAVPDDNPEVVEALRLGIPVLKRADFLGALMADRVGIAIAGSHGKTTTTAMAAWVFSQLGQDPSFIIGGVSQDLGVNAKAGKGAHFIIEADEYDRMFLGLKPVIAVVTNIEHDHPDCYPTAEEFSQAFSDFAGLLPEEGCLVACLDDPLAAALAKQMKGRTGVCTYGTAADAAYRAESPAVNPQGGSSFEAVLAGERVRLDLQVPGLHNVLNALAVLAVVDRCGLDKHEAAKILSQFSGAGRRFEVLGEAGGITVITDYGHHPTEIRVTLEAARRRYPGKRVWAVWQPHTYSRTRLLFEAFAQAFADAGQVIVSEVYASREVEPDGGYSARQVVEAMGHPHARFIPTLAEITETLVHELQPGDVLIVFSAGDGDQVCQQVLDRLQSGLRTNLRSKEQQHVETKG